MQPILSVLIPCYNSGQFIESTILMLLEQDLSDCELIFVNDGSTDNTLAILQKYQDVRDCIRVINQLNQGVSVARNTALSAARGKYVYFLDSDDTLTLGSMACFKQMLSAHKECQMFAFGYETRKNGVRVKSYVYPRFDDREITSHILTQSFLAKKLCVNICSCIYERDFLIKNQCYFMAGITIGEDVLFLLQTMFKVNKMYYTKRVSFVYQIRDDSTMKGYKSYSLAQYASHTLLREFLLPITKNDKSMHHSINFFLLFSYLSNLRYYLRSDVCSQEINKKFIADGSIRYKCNFTTNLPIWLVMKVTAFIPLRLVLYVLKQGWQKSLK